MGIIPLVAVLILAVASSAVIGGEYLLNLAKQKGLFTGQLPGLIKDVETQSGYLDETRVKNSFFDDKVVGTVLLSNGAFSAYKVINGEVGNKGNFFTGDIKISFLSGDQAFDTFDDGTIAPFYLKDGTKTVAQIVDRMIANLVLDQNTSYAIKILQGKVEEGRLTGNFVGQTYDNGFLIAGTVDTAGKITNIVVKTGAQKTTEAESSIAKNAISLFQSISEISISTDILGISDYQPIGFNKPIFDESTGTWAFAGGTSQGAVSTSPVQGIVNYLQNAVKSISNGNSVYQQIAGGVMQGITEIKSDNSKLTVTTLNNIATLSLDLTGVTATGISDSSINESNLISSNDPTGGQCLTYNSSTGGFTWGSCGTSGGSGTITGVTAGNGLTGGGTSGALSLSLHLQSNGGLVATSSGLSLIRTCGDGELLKWTDSTSSWDCATDAGGAGGGISTLQVDDVTVVSSATTIDLLGTDFDLTNSPTGEGNLSIDYTNSKIVRSDQTQSIGGAWTFVTAPVISTISNTGTLTLPISTDTLVGRATSDTLTNKTIAAGSNTISGLSVTNFTSANISQWTNNSNYLTDNQTITLSGDVSGSGATAISTTIGSGAVSLSKMANLAANSIIGNNTGSAATPVALTATQVKTLLGISTSDISGLGTIATQSASNIYVTGGQISGVTIAGTASGLTISGASNTLSNIGNSSLSNSSVTINSSGILSGGGSLSLGGTLNLLATEADTFSSVTGRGASTATALTLSSATPITFSGTTPTITFSGGNTIFDLTGATTRTLNILNSTTSQVANVIVDGTISASNFSGTSSGTNTGDQTITLTSDVTGTGTGSFATTIAGGAVTLGKMANLAANSIIGNNTGSSATPIALTGSQVKTLLGISTSDVSGLGTIATQSASNVFITGGSLSGLTSVGATTFTGALTGNASTATALATARTIAGTSFDGSANISLANNFIVQGTSDPGLSGAQFLGALGTGIVKNTATTGVLSIAVAGDFPTLNQNTTGTASNITSVLGATSFPALSGDVTNTEGSLATAIASGAVTLGKMANLAANSIIGNNTGSAATPIALTGSQVKTLLGISTSDVSGLGTIATQSASNVFITGGQLSGLVTINGATITGGNLSGTAVNGITTADIALTTGSYANPSWITSLAETKTLPSQTGNSGKVLGTNGTSTSWITNSSGVAWGAITGTLTDQTDLNTALSGKLGTSLTSANIFVGNGSGIATGVAVTGDISIDNTGLTTIGSGTVSLTKMANLAANSIIGNNTGSPATPLALTTAQVKTLLGISTSDVSGLGTIATQSASNVYITGGQLVGGTINNITIGGTTRAGGNFTILDSNGNTTLGDTNTDTLTIKAGSSGAGITLYDSSFANCSALETVAGVLTCGTDDTGAGGGISTIQIGDADVVTSATTVDFLAADFDVTNSPAGEGNISIDYTNSKITRTDQVQSISGGWTFSDLTISDINIPLTGASLALDFNNALDRTLTITNSSTGLANLSIEGTIGASNFSGSSSGTNTGDQTITLTSDVTGSGTGSFATTIASGAVTLGKMANLAANSIIGNNTGSSATPIALTASQVKTLLGISTSDVSGLGTIATQSASNVFITGGQLSGLVTINGATITGGNLSGTAVNGITTADIALTTGSYANPSWITSLAETKTLPSQTGNSGKVLGTNGTSTSWITNSSGVAWGAITGLLDDQTDLTASLSGKLSKTLTSANIFVGNVSNIATGVAISGDVTMDNTGLTTIGSGKVTFGKMADLAANSIIGNNTGSPATPIALSASQVKTLLGISTTDVSGLGTIATQSASNVFITGGQISGGTVGGTASGLTISAGTNTISGITASNLTAGDFSSVVNSGSYSISITGSAGSAGTVTGFSPVSGKTLTLNKSMTLTAADDTGVYTLPTGTKTLVATDVTSLTSLTSIGTLGGLTVTGAATINTTGTSNTSIGNGTGTVTLTLGSDATGDIYYRGAGGNITRLADVAAGSCLNSGGVGAAPTWGSCGAGGGVSTIKEGGTNIVTSAVALNYVAADFIITDETAGVAGITIDYANSKIIRKSDSAVTFDAGATFSTTGNLNGVTINTATGASGNSGAITIQTGGTSVSGTSGSVTIDTGAGVTSNGAITIGGTNASNLTIGRATVTTTVNGTLAAGGVLISGGSINGTTLGASTPSTGAFTTLSATGAITGATATNTINGIIINSGAVSGVSTIGLSGAITGATATNTINGLIVNSGALSGITTISTSSTINGATISGGTLSGGSLSGGTYSGTAISGTGSYTITGGTGVSETLTLISTSNVTKGDIQFFSASNKLTSAGALTVAGAITGVGVNAGSGQIQGTGGLSLTGATSINTTGTSNTSIGNGTGTISLTLGSDATGDIYYRGAGGNLVRLADVAAGSCLNSGGVGAAPTWGSCGAGGGSLDVAYNSGATITVDAYDVLLNLSDATNDYKFTIDNATTGDIATAFAITSTGVGGTTAVAIDLSDADIVTALSLGSNDVTVGGVTITSTEFALLDGHDVALVDTNDAVSTAITGVGTLGSLTVSGAIAGATATNTINGLIINSGALSGITTINASGQITSTLVTGTAPFVVASTTNVANLNASSLNGATFAAPGSIGSTTAGTGAFTTLSATGAITGATATNTINGLIINSGALSGATTLGLSGAITAATATNTINGIIINSGAVSGVTTLGASSTVTIGSGGNTFTFDPTSGPVYAGTAMPTKRITLTPEYAGATLTGDGTSNTGTMTSDAETASPFKNYYNWTSTQGTAQDYDIWIKIPLPSDFSAMASTDSLTVEARSDNLANTAITIVQVYDTANAADCTTGNINIEPGTVNTWADTTPTDTCTGGTYAADGIMTVQLRVSALSSANAKVGRLYLQYKAKF